MVRPARAAKPQGGPAALLAQLAGGVRYLRRPVVWRLSVSKWVSDWGDAVHILAFNWLVVQQSGSAADVLICQALWLAGQLSAAWPGGWLVDRLGGKRTLVASYLLHAAVIGVLTLLALQSRIGIWLFAGFSVLLGVLGAISEPAQRALIKQAAEDNTDLGRLNGLLSAGGSLAQGLGPLLAGRALMVIPMGWGFALNALSFVVAGWALLGLRLACPLPPAEPEQSGAAPANGRLFDQIRPLLPGVIAASGIVFGPGALLVVFLPYYVQQVQHWPVVALGTLESARSLGLGVGGLVGSLAIARLSGLSARLFAFAAALLPLPLTGFWATSGGSDWLPQAAWLAGVGTAAGFAYVCLNQWFLEQTDQQWIGRVNSSLAIYAALGLLGFGGLWSLAVEHAGFRMALGWATAGCTLSAIPALLAARRRRSN